jgi:GH43 family beta-xylosidase
MKKTGRKAFILMAMLFVAGCHPETTVPDDNTPKEEKAVKMTLNGTMLRSSVADPCIVCYNGLFYMTMTGASNVAMAIDSDLSRLTTSAHPTPSNLIYKSAEDPSVREIFGDGATINGTWSPEIHYFSEEDCPGNAGWYMVFALRMDDSAGSSSHSSAYIRPVVLKSLGRSPSGPYGNPVTGAEGVTQRFLDAAGQPFEDWAIGVSFLRIPSGKYKGIYATWVDEVGRGEGYGKFYQRLRIARLSKPWQIASEASTITTPTQDWEKKGASSTLPMVVEGGTAVYGDNGEIFLTYCGSGYWSDYGQGQLTLARDGGDYADPLKESSWIKYAGNPVFSSAPSSDLRGAGHVFFFNDPVGNRYFCYHAYPFSGGVKQSNRNAYMEPFAIDYDAREETAPQGVLRFGLNGNGVTAPVNSQVTWWYKRGE